MPQINRWWAGLDGEDCWLEVTRRADIGANLKAPQRNEVGEEFWSYSLLKEVRSGDTIFHYDGVAQCITASSVAVGTTWEDDILWAARGSSARSAGIEPHLRKGWYYGLEQFQRLPNPVTLEAVRAQATSVKQRVLALETTVGAPLYFPFELGNKRPLRPMQGYLFKLPCFFLELFAVAKPKVSLAARKPSSRMALVGDVYRAADEQMSLPPRDPFAVDPALVERGFRGHARTQNALAHHLMLLGLTPLSPSASEPNFDLAWYAGGITYVAEIKSVTHANEEKQLRLALGQVLRYAAQLDAKGPVKPVIVLEREPRDKTWEALCERYDVSLAWPEVLVERITAN